MRKDQIERIADLSERLADVFITEADPDNWNGSGQALRDMDEKQRGGRYWDKKNAIQTGTLLARVMELEDRCTGRSFVPLPSEGEADADIRRFEKKAKELIDGIQAKSARAG